MWSSFSSVLLSVIPIGTWNSETPLPSRKKNLETSAVLIGIIVVVIVSCCLFVYVIEIVSFLKNEKKNLDSLEPSYMHQKYKPHAHIIKLMVFE
jgi:hypothetical protein